MIWETAFNTAVDQSDVRKVGFSSRGWVTVKMLLRIKKELGKGIKTRVILSRSMANKTGLKYLARMFEKMVGLKILFYSNLEDAIQTIGDM